MIDFYRKYKSAINFGLRVVGIYLLFYLSFQFLIGLGSPGGLLSSDLIARLSPINAYRNVLLWASGGLLKLMSFEISTDQYVLSIVGHSGIRLVYGCLGIELTSAYSALILAYPKVLLKRRLIFLFGGILLIVLLNILRIAGLTYIYAFYDSDYLIIDQHDLFNMAVIFTLLLVYRTFLKQNQTVS